MTSYYKIDHCMFTFASGLPRPPALTGWNADWVDLSVVFKYAGLGILTQWPPALTGWNADWVDLSVAFLICCLRNLGSKASSPDGWSADGADLSVSFLHIHHLLSPTERIRRLSSGNAIPF